jgi:hypothetical protein
MTMTPFGWLVGGFAATVVLTTLMAGAQGLGRTRMSIPYLLGSMFTPDRDRAKLLGVGLHLVNGLVFSLVYLALFQAWGRATWWGGAAIGLVHAGFLLTAGMEVLPAIHPRMASEQRGPTIVRQLEPPGFLALHYGVQTPVTVLVAHLVYGAILGGFYTVG